MSFPRQLARTRRFTLGVPRAATIAPDGRRLLFLRSASGADPATGIWEAELRADGSTAERCVVDPQSLVAADAALPEAERARRERAREQASGITAYATDQAVELIAFVLGGTLFTHDLVGGRTVAHPSAGPAFDPRPSPDGTRVAYLSGDGMHVLELPGGPGQPGVTRPLLLEEGVAWGRAEFVAAEEMRRSRGYWWAPDSCRVAVARVDESAVARWHLADAAKPWEPPRAHPYPAAGTADADVRLAVVSLGDGRRIDVASDREAMPYLARVAWDTDPEGEDRLTLQVQSRDQRRSEILRVDPRDGGSRALRTLGDAAWVKGCIPGSPAWSGRSLVTVEDLDGHGPGGSRALLVDGRPVSPPGMQVRSIVAADAVAVHITASEADPTQVHLHRWADGRLERLTGPEPGVSSATVLGDARLVTTRSLSGPRPRAQVTWAGEPSRVHGLRVLSEQPVVAPAPRFLEFGERRLRGALLLPSTGDDRRRLPVVLDPYGGPHAQRVLADATAFATSQWIADQGFAVLVVDGRGSPGRGPRWERALRGDLATIPLADQLDALTAAGEVEPRLDLGRVGIRGWSFGGFLAALAALRAPATIRAAIAGAPVTDWRLYDTHYTHRYLGTPQEAADAYAVSSLVDADAALGPAQPWPVDGAPALLIIHGLADDNVVAAHSLRLSSALLADGRAHRFLPLSGVTHMTPQEVVTEQLLLLQVRFLQEALGRPER